MSAITEIETRGRSASIGSQSKTNSKITILKKFFKPKKGGIQNGFEDDDLTLINDTEMIVSPESSFHSSFHSSTSSISQDSNAETTRGSEETVEQEIEELQFEMGYEMFMEKYEEPKKEKKTLRTKRSLFDFKKQTVDLEKLEKSQEPQASHYTIGTNTILNIKRREQKQQQQQQQQQHEETETEKESEPEKVNEQVQAQDQAQVSVTKLPPKISTNSKISYMDMRSSRSPNMQTTFGVSRPPSSSICSENSSFSAFETRSSMTSCVSYFTSKSRNSVVSENESESAFTP